MPGYLTLPFIQKKIEVLQNALFFSLSDSILKMPACLIHVLATDDLGQIWFLMPKPAQHIHAFDQEFPVKLDFFRKGSDFYLKIVGKAFIVIDPEEINSLNYLGQQVIDAVRKNQSVLMKIKISYADYFENAVVKPLTLSDRFKNLKLQMLHWLNYHRNGYRALTFRQSPPVAQLQKIMSN